ncbi:carbon-monoxide dehydrogenase medium subunit [Nitratireductor aquibiodomus]|uniref:Carbon-monoxide dehydrogenase medium subunit n=1 Tax=Nitratireductor aquibiodomus TaxID=204799 RepID=A0A1H4JY35_9HYPH|nr:xanthine dehydrogenase family protein subunit M [Nitratireductor aquibiodomus]SEB51219.1 carbon-monoxide dehydrogenase medium subunit [Nitratireductor aquibiodomus]
MYDVTYHRAGSVQEALDLLESADDGKFLAGGQTLIPAMKTRLAAPSDLVDLRHIAELQTISVAGKTVTIGAGTTHAKVAANSEIGSVCPALSHLAALIGDPQVRHMGTIGGSLANNDPAADYPAAMLALAATIVTSKREIAARDFFTGLFETALDEDELITAIRFEAPEKAGYGKFPNPASRYAMTGVFVVQDGETVRAAVTGAGDDGVFLCSELESALSADFSAAALDGITVPADSLMTDIHANADYRASLIVAMARRAVTMAIG